MYWSNYHSHSTFCDGRSSMEEFVRFAIAKGVKKYGFSSHAPLPFPTHWTMPEGDYVDYQQEFYRLREKYKSEIELFLGLEIDYIEGCSDAGHQFFSDKKLDYSIGSVHYPDSLGNNNDYWSIDGDFAEFNNGLQLLYKGNIREATEHFFEVTNKMIVSGGFDIVGHVDKITYHGRKYSDFKMEDKWYTDLMTNTLELIRSRGMLLEINTKSLREHGITYPHQSFYSLINEIGIPVMVNSDCHYPTNITDGFRVTYKALKEAGFEALHQLIAGQWKPVPFDINGLND